MFSAKCLYFHCNPEILKSLSNVGSLIYFFFFPPDLFIIESFSAHIKRTEQQFGCNYNNCHTWVCLRQTLLSILNNLPPFSFFFWLENVLNPIVLTSQVYVLLRAAKFCFLQCVPFIRSFINPPFFSPQLWCFS